MQGLETRLTISSNGSMTKSVERVVTVNGRPAIMRLSKRLWEKLDAMKTGAFPEQDSRTITVTRDSGTQYQIKLD